MATQRVAIFSVSAGAGHTRAAQAIADRAAASFPDVEAVHVDVMDLVPAPFRRTYTAGYTQLITRSPGVWGYLYSRTDRGRGASNLERFRTAVERLNTRRFVARLRELDPDVVICTHFLPAQLLSRMTANGTFDKPVWVQVTDFDIHASWLQEHVTGYLVAHDELAYRMVERGVPPDRLHVTGIPINPAFTTAPSRAACAAELGVDPARPTLALMAGGSGVTGILPLAERLLALGGDAQVIALAGSNEDLLGRLRTLAARHPGRLFPMGFTRTIERVMAASDLAITKAGGLTTSECLAMGLPMILFDPIPGQEERNADFLLERGAAEKAIDAASLAWRVRELLANPAHLETMRAAALATGRPDAARRVLEIVLSRR